MREVRDAIPPAEREARAAAILDRLFDLPAVTRAAGVMLFDAFGSAEKSLHANAGPHAGVPRFEVDSAVRFFARHLLA